MTKYKYSFKVFWSDEDGGYVAICPELPGVSALGDTESEALREAKVAMELYVEDMLESGEALPEPQTARVYSGQTRLRMSKTLHRLAAQMAEDEGVSLNQYCADAIQARVAGEQVANSIVTEVRYGFAEQTRQRQAVLRAMEQRLSNQMDRHGMRLASYMNLLEGQTGSVTALAVDVMAIPRQGYNTPRRTAKAFGVGGGRASLTDFVLEGSLLS